MSTFDYITSNHKEEVDQSVLYESLAFNLVAEVLGN